MHIKLILWSVIVTTIGSHTMEAPTHVVLIENGEAYLVIDRETRNYRFLRMGEVEIRPGNYAIYPAGGIRVARVSAHDLKAPDNCECGEGEKTCAECDSRSKDYICGIWTKLGVVDGGRVDSDTASALASMCAAIGQTRRWNGHSNVAIGARCIKRQ